PRLTPPAEPCCSPPTRSAQRRGKTARTAPVSRKRWGRAGSALPVAVLAFLILPIAVVVVLSFSSGRLLEFPPPGLSLKWYRGLLADPELLDSLSLSLWIAAWSSTIALVTGTGAAYALTRHA